jgi:hypothetical protein
MDSQNNWFPLRKQIAQAFCKSISALCVFAELPHLEGGKRSVLTTISFLWNAL